MYSAIHRFGEGNFFNTNKILRVALSATFLTIIILMNAGSINAAIAGDCNNDGSVNLIDFQLLSNSFGKSSGQTGYDGRCDFNGSNSIDLLDFQILSNNFGQTGTISTPTRSATATPTRTPTSAPTPTGSNPPVSAGQWGIYPNCNPPAMPVEAQSWWSETQVTHDHNSRHIHGAACMPHARDSAGNTVSVRGTFEFTRVVTIFNNDIRITKVDNGFPDAGDVEFPVRFNPPLTCSGIGPCTFYTNNRINTTIRPDGLRELRWRVEGTHPEIGNDTEFISFGTKIYIRNSGGGGTGGSPNPRARGWYEGVNYDTVEITNYTNLYRGRTDITVPIVSGVVPLQMNHTQSSGSGLRSKLFLDPNFHLGIQGTLLYDKPGLFQGTYNLDTTRIPNGRHVLLAQTEHTVSNGVHSGLLKLFIDVRN